MAQRSRVGLASSPTVRGDRLVVLGVDPGFASTGVAVVSKSEGQRARCVALQVIRTQKRTEKGRRDLRVSAEDGRRLREIWSGLSEIAGAYSPQALAFEVYTPFRAQGGSAWKAARVEGAVQIFGLERNMVVLPFLPQDLKRGLLGRMAGSKEEVEAALIEKLEGFGEAVQKIGKTLKEHVSDAAGHAYLALEEIGRLRLLLR